VANIDLQRKEGQPPWVWIAAIIGLIIVAAIIWAAMSNRDDRGDDRLRRDTVPAARDTIVGWIDDSGEALPEYIVLLG
jgi:hypothetical protein